MEILLPANPSSLGSKQDGFFYEGGKDATGFFLAEQSWYFFVGASVFNTNAIEAINRKYTATDRVDLEISLKNGQLIRADYRVGGKIEGDPTPFVEDEDFDYGLFFENVVLNENRLRRISEAWNSS